MGDRRERGLAFHQDNARPRTSGSSINLGIFMPIMFAEYYLFLILENLLGDNHQKKIEHESLEVFV